MENVEINESIESLKWPMLMRLSLNVMRKNLGGAKGRGEYLTLSAILLKIHPIVLFPSVLENATFFTAIAEPCTALLLANRWQGVIAWHRHARMILSVGRAAKNSSLSSTIATLTRHLRAPNRCGLASPTIQCKRRAVFSPSR
jgi:hypothetical protein